MPAPINRDDLLTELRRLADELGRSPSANDMTEYGRHSVTTYSKQFGSWKEAKDAAGLTQCSRGAQKTPRSELLQDLRSLSEELGKIPAASDMEDHGPRSATTYQRRFGSWESARREAGFPHPNPEHNSTEEFVASIKDLAEEVGRAPTMREMDTFGEFASQSYINRFGSWADALEEAGFEPRPPSVTALPSGRVPPPMPMNGPGWARQRRKALERDGYECQSCGKTRDENREQLGRDLDVHHITPREEFYDEEDGFDWKAAHDLDNLISLCRGCHLKQERNDSIVVWS